MPSKYYNLMSKINADEEFKEKLVKDLEKNLVENFENSENKKEKVGIMSRIKKAIITVISILTLLVGGGLVYASVGGTIYGIPVLEWAGIKFSENYSDYVEPVQNQVLENDDIKVALESTVSDYGFTILQFRVNISKELANENMTDDEGVNICYLSFNDPVINQYGELTTDLGGANYNLIIDGKEVWVRGRTAQSIEKLNNYEFLVYQMYFLDDKILKGNEEYNITLKDVVLDLGNGCNEIAGQFDVQVSKEKAKNNTTVITPSEDVCLKYKKMEKIIEEVYLTPLQNIIKVKTVFKNVDVDDLTYTLDKDYVDTIEYFAFNQNGNSISSHTIETEARITYDDGVVEELIPGDFEFSKNFKNATYEITEMIAVEQNESINEIILNAYEISRKEEKEIGEYKINLNTNKVTKSDKIGLDEEDSGKVSEENPNTEDIQVTNNIINEKEVISVLQNIQNKQLSYIKVESIEKASNAYLVTASLYNPVIITESEYNKLVKEGKITLNNQIYKYQVDDGGIYGGTIKSNYGFVISNDNADLYAIDKYEDGYIMYLEVGGVTWSIDNKEKTLKFYLEAKTIVSELAGIEDTTLEKYYSTFDDDFIKNNKVTIECGENNKIMIYVDAR